MLKNRDEPRERAYDADERGKKGEPKLCDPKGLHFESAREFGVNELTNAASAVCREQGDGLSIHITDDPYLGICFRRQFDSQVTCLGE